MGAAAMTKRTQLLVSQDVLERIHDHGASSYPEEGAGLMLGRDGNGQREVVEILPLTNAREDEARHNRYLIIPQDMLMGEREAMRLGLDIVGIFHSHPDHSNNPSEFDREWALPWFSYLITSVQGGEPSGSRSWRLAEDRQSFYEEVVSILEINEG
jgi:proteasome lid subunit RPN8/RPN11